MGCLHSLAALCHNQNRQLCGLLRPPYLLQGNEPSFKDSMVSKRVWRSPESFPVSFKPSERDPETKLTKTPK